MSRIGMGFDAHPFGDERPLRLGGLDWPGERKLVGHSDGDALLHAICEALLGASGLGSLGGRFSDADPAGAGRDSAEILAAVWREAGGRYRLGNLDATVVAQSPRLEPRRMELEERVASILGVERERVSIRGKSSNGLGFPGRAEGIAAMAVVLLEPR